MSVLKINIAHIIFVGLYLLSLLAWLGQTVQVVLAVQQAFVSSISCQVITYLSVQGIRLGRPAGQITLYNIEEIITAYHSICKSYPA